MHLLVTKGANVDSFTVIYWFIGLLVYFRFQFLLFS